MGDRHDNDMLPQLYNNGGVRIPTRCCMLRYGIFDCNGTNGNTSPTLRGVFMSMNQRRRLLKLFLQNTGGQTMVRPPRMNPSDVQLYGYQMPRMDKYRWQGKL
jgi:hypothetical protein